MNHDEYWKKVMNHSEKTLCGLFEGHRTRVRDIVGDDNGIGSPARSRSTSTRFVKVQKT